MQAIVCVALIVLFVGSPTASMLQRRTNGAPRHDLVGRTFDAQVTRIADGDTVEAVPVGETRIVRIRLHGVDAPEIDEPFSTEAMTRLRALLMNGPVRIDGRDLDRYGRLVARVVAGNDASVELVRAGLACHAYARDEVLAAEERQARAAGRGFWAATARKPACVAQTAFSARRSPASPSASPRSAPPLPPPGSARGGYRGNTNSALYHVATCPNARCRNCTRLFSSEAEAKAAGFKPAVDCVK